MRDVQPMRSAVAHPASRPAAGPPRTPPAAGALTIDDAEAYVRGICFKTGPPRRIGVELEWIVQDVNDPALPVDQHHLAEALATLTVNGSDGSATSGLPTGAAITREPGGQVELSSLPADSLPQCVEGVHADLATLRAALRTRGYTLVGFGHDPWRPPVRVLDLPRYAAMEEFFDRTGSAGRNMMGASASVQVCLDAGTEDSGPTGYARRWRLAHLLGPVFVAAFANSPLWHGRPSGWRSTRQAVWSRMDPSRTLAPQGADGFAGPESLGGAHPFDGPGGAATGPVPGTEPVSRGPAGTEPASGGPAGIEPVPGIDPREAWARYALDAALLCLRREDGQPWTAPARVSFRQWIDGGAGCAPEVDRPPTVEDLAYHLTTLFPPVRPQGHLELRMIDAQPGDDGWIVPLAVVTALFDDEEAALTAETVAGSLITPGARAPRNPLWIRAARDGLTDPQLRQAAEACFTAAAAALPRLGATDEIRAAVADFAQRHVARGRCPADDLLDAVRGSRARTLPAPGRETPRC
ncbi:ergothioneine biosynthesis glutamate--cysteine ligase EgtA [Wenjunlia tyrosinilytica]|uniref:Glutamate--cysteine ligase EgtA n=1 Tax=Wenjunlia tyrosinilytica TaxID=1544741 RepID=A0A917ZXN5_9ACTN|nr:ergothioneine biosynthesis glutamate--cysteine ligase EgtA [Wenjunlia tyrosinilytica]GGO95955.1 glutamate--cysteine ligase EgtA [Wenjunlia tyrosinilytica]